jgi:hypothetical protein
MANRLRDLIAGGGLAIATVAKFFALKRVSDMTRAEEKYLR